MSVGDDWERAADQLIDALKHAKEMRGKPGDQIAQQDVVKALKKYNEASEKLG